MIRIRPVVAWYDLWVGAFWDSKRGRLYLMPLPCLGFYVQWGLAAIRESVREHYLAKYVEIDRELEHCISLLSPPTYWTHGYGETLLDGAIKEVEWIFECEWDCDVDGWATGSWMF